MVYFDIFHPETNGSDAVAFSAVIWYAEPVFGCSDPKMKNPPASGLACDAAS